MWSKENDFRDAFSRAVIAATCGFMLLLNATSIALASQESDTSLYRQFIDGIAGTLYFFAWPTATYTGVTLNGISRVNGGVDINIKLNGVSALDNGPLWTEVILEVRNGEISDIRWGRNNAILFQPGESMTAFGEALAELNREYQSSTLAEQQFESAQVPSGYPFYVTNNCHHSIKLAIRYVKTNGDWDIIGWWKFNGNSSRYLKFKNGNQPLTNSAIFYYHAKAADDSFFWTGGDRSKMLDFTLDGNIVPMVRVEDKEGESELTLSCPSS